MIMNSSPEPSPLLPPDSPPGRSARRDLEVGEEEFEAKKLLESAEIAHSSHGVGDQCTLIMDYESERRPGTIPIAITMRGVRVWRWPTAR
jgi:hypothetical protein